MGNEGDATDDQFGPRCLDQQVSILSWAPPRPAFVVERDGVIGAGPLTVLDLGLGDGCLEVDVPDRRRVAAVGLAAGEVVEKRPLADPAAGLADGRVQQGPVDRQPDPAEDFFEDGFVGGRQLFAQLDEVRPRDGQLLGALGHVATERRGERGVIGLRRVTSHAVVVLDAALGGQAVVVPPEGEEDLLAAHPVVPGHGVELGVAEDRAHVHRTRDGRGWRVDGEHLAAPGRAVEAVHPGGLPRLGPARFDAVERGLVGGSGHPGKDKEPRPGSRPTELGDVRSPGTVTARASQRPRPVAVPELGVTLTTGAYVRRYAGRRCTRRCRACSLSASSVHPPTGCRIEVRQRPCCHGETPRLARRAVSGRAGDQRV